MTLAGMWNIKTVYMPRLSDPHPVPNRSPAKRVRFGEEEQQNERGLTYKISRSKRYDACSDVVERIAPNTNITYLVGGFAITVKL